MICHVLFWQCLCFPSCVSLPDYLVCIFKHSVFLSSLLCSPTYDNFCYYYLLLCIGILFLHFWLKPSFVIYFRVSSSNKAAFSSLPFVSAVLHIGFKICLSHSVSWQNTLEATLDMCRRLRTFALLKLQLSNNCYSVCVVSMHTIIHCQFYVNQSFHML